MLRLACIDLRRPCVNGRVNKLFCSNRHPSYLTNVVKLASTARSYIIQPDNRIGSSKVYLSTASNVGANEENGVVLIYESSFYKKLRMLRRVSFGSSLLSIFGIPIAMSYATGTVPFVGQVVIVGTALFTSLSSTLFLQVVTHPYVATLHEVKGKVDAAPPAMDERRFKATRINVFGQIVETEFALKEAQRITSGHPFASVKIRGANFYIFGGRIEEKELRHRLTNEI